MAGRSSWAVWALGIGLSLAPLMASAAEPAVAPASAPTARENEIAGEAYAYLYPLVIMDVTRRQQTGRPSGVENGMSAPVNSFSHRQSFPPGDFKAVVRPNFDTLYSTAWLDLAKEPVVLSIGDTKGRYFMMPLYDLWTDTFAVPGSQTLPPSGGTFAVTAPGWKGDLPMGVQRIESPTRYVWIIGRVQTNGPADYPAVHAIQKAFALSPLSQVGKPPKPPAEAEPAAASAKDADMTLAPLTIVNRMDAATFFTTALRLMVDNPPHAIDQPQLARLKMIGLVPGPDFDFAALSPAVRQALKDAKTIGPMRLAQYAARSGQQRGVWRVMTVSIGSYGADYDQRASIAMWGLGANRPVDAIYPRTDRDEDGRMLDGANRYVVHFKAGALPPVSAFWSLTAYDASGFTVPNKTDRYAIGDRDKLAYNADGSLDLYLQNEDPGPEKRANWLPIAPGKVNLNLRLYLPKPSALDGEWPMPTITRQEGAAR